MRIIDHVTNIKGTKLLFRELKLLNFDNICKLALSFYGLTTLLIATLQEIWTLEGAKNSLGT